MSGMTPSRARITGWGTALPDKVVTNADLEDGLDTSDAWIVERTGIRERRVGGTTTGLFFYDATLGEGRFFSTDGKGGMAPIGSVQTGLRKSWSRVIPGTFLPG